MYALKTVGLFVLTAVAEIVGCYLPYLWLRKSGPIWYLAPAAVSLAAFAYLLTLHPTSAGRTYAAYGGVYVAVAVLWMWISEGQKPDRWDIIGARSRSAEWRWSCSVRAGSDHGAGVLGDEDGEAARSLEADVSLQRYAAVSREAAPSVLARIPLDERHDDRR